jgi:hypothetical protein
MTTLVEKTITAENTFSDSFRFDGDFNTGTTVTVQRSIDDSTWTDVDTFTSISENVGFEPELLFYRAGVKTGEFGAGTNITVRIGAKWMTLT